MVSMTSCSFASNDVRKCELTHLCSIVEWSRLGEYMRTESLFPTYTFNSIGMSLRGKKEDNGSIAVVVTNDVILLLDTSLVILFFVFLAWRSSVHEGIS